MLCPFVLSLPSHHLQQQKSTAPAPFPSLLQHAKFARKKLLRTLQYMDPSIIEAHTGMKVLTKDEFSGLQTDLEKARKDVREMNTKVQEKFSDVLKTSMELQNMKTDIDELKKLIAEKEAAAPAAAAAAAAEPAAAAAAG
mmetsp:Transcript_28341/g.53496  ORF Transcript_28341/g.53496 Transcript_28341/m.53496 type:complete len:140 (-) Transcript_28341:359-778(-)